MESEPRFLPLMQDGAEQTLSFDDYFKKHAPPGAQA
jgi:hypothetical protein